MTNLHQDMSCFHLTFFLSARIRLIVFYNGLVFTRQTLLSCITCTLMYMQTLNMLFLESLISKYLERYEFKLPYLENPLSYHHEDFTKNKANKTEEKRKTKNQAENRRN